MCGWSWIVLCSFSGRPESNEDSGLLPRRVKSFESFDGSVAILAMEQIEDGFTRSRDEGNLNGYYMLVLCLSIVSERAILYRVT